MKDKLEDTKGEIRSRKSKKGRKYNVQTKTKKTNRNGPQNTTYKTKNGQHEPNLKPRVNSGVH